MGWGLGGAWEFRPRRASGGASAPTHSAPGSRGNRQGSPAEKPVNVQCFPSQSERSEMKSQGSWSPISLGPETGALPLRSRPGGSTARPNLRSQRNCARPEGARAGRPCGLRVHPTPSTAPRVCGSPGKASGSLVVRALGPLAFWPLAGVRTPVLRTRVLFLVGCGPGIGKILRAFGEKSPDPKTDKCNPNGGADRDTGPERRALPRVYGSPRPPRPPRGAKVGRGARKLGSWPLAARGEVVSSALGALLLPLGLR